MIERSLPRRLGFSLMAAYCVVVSAASLTVAFAEALHPIPAFDLESVDGTRVTSKALEGKVVLVDFWATWCAPCIEEIPQWNELYARYRDKGFVVLGMTIRSGWAKDIKPDAAKLKIGYPVVVGNDDLEKGFGGIWGFPTTSLKACTIGTASFMDHAKAIYENEWAFIETRINLGMLPEQFTIGSARIIYVYQSARRSVWGRQRSQGY